MVWFEWQISLPPRFGDAMGEDEMRSDTTGWEISDSMGE